MREKGSPKPNPPLSVTVREKNLKLAPQLPAKDWVDGNDTLVRYVSCHRYFLQKKFIAKTRCPLELFPRFMGGTRIEQWQPDWSYVQSPLFKDSVTGTNFKIDGMHRPNVQWAD